MYPWAPSDNCKVHVALPKFWAGTSRLFGWSEVLGFFGVRRFGRELGVITGECYFAFIEESHSEKRFLLRYNCALHNGWVAAQSVDGAFKPTLYLHCIYHELTV